MKKQLIIALALVCPAATISAKTGRLVSVAKSIEEVIGNAYETSKEGLKSATNAVSDAAKDSWKATTSFVADHCNRALYDNLKDKALNFPAKSLEAMKENPKITAAIATGIIVVGYFGYKLGKKCQEKKKTA